ncbi:MAG: PD40 domain-containing protein [Acidobacteria bacterium]|nr:PD40 domain-containing protein [Candidatus Sulfomarinibacter sp. MAG AM2]
MMGQQQGNPITSTLPTLFPAWGINFESGQVVADPALATKLAGNRSGLAVLTLTEDEMPQKDNVITKDLDSVTLFLPGAFTNTGGAGITSNTLLRSTKGAGFVDSAQAAQLDPALETTFRSSGTAYDLFTRLSGTFKTAFPDGKPDPGEQGDGKPAVDESKAEYLTESAQPGNVFLIGDVDAFYDSFAYSVQNFGGMQMATPINGNSSMLFNLLDQATGSRHLIGSRSRSAVRRPFTVVQKLEADFNEKVGTKIEEFQEKQRAAQQKLNDLQAQKSGGNELYPLWTPDGRRLAYLSYANEAGIFAKAADGSSTEERLTPSDTTALFPESFSPDGRTLAYTRLGATNDIYLISQGEEARLFEQMASCADISPDGRWIAYSSPGSGVSSVYVRPLEGEGKWQVSPNLGAYARWSGDGRRLFYIDIGLPKRPLMVVDVAPSDRFQIGPPRVVLENLGGAFVTSTAPALNWDVSPSGDRFVFVEFERRAQAAAQVEIALNWAQHLELEQR